MSSEKTFFRFFTAGLDADENTRQKILAEAKAADVHFPPRLQAFWANKSLDRSSFYEELADFAPKGPCFPKAFDDLRLEEEIGKGGMGIVYRARQISLNREVAVKFLSQRGITTDNDEAADEARIMKEAHLLAQLSHTNIVGIHGSGCLTIGERRFPYLFMPLRQGLPLDAFLAQNDLSLRERMLLLLQVCRGLQHSHAQFINHRDLKPSNLLVSNHDGRPHLQIIDFGLAAKGDEHLCGGTEGFLPPEAKAGKTIAGVTSDIYATGVILHMMLADAAPQDGKLCSQVAAEGGPRAIAPHRLRGDLDALCAKAMAHDPKQRYQTVQDLADDIRAWLETKPLSAVPHTRSYVYRKFIHRRRSHIAAACFACVLLLGWADSFNHKMRLEQDKLKQQTLLLEQKAALLRSDRQKVKVHDILIEMFRHLDPSRGGLKISVRDLLLRGEKVLKEADYEADPSLQGAAFLAMANTFEEVGMYEKAAQLSLRAAQLFHGEGPTGTLDYLEALRHRAFQLNRLAQRQEAKALYEFLLAHPEMNKDPVGLFKVQTGLAGVYVEERDTQRAIALLDPALATGRKLIGLSDATTLAAQDTLARALVLDGKLNRALPLFADAHLRLSTTLGADHPRTLTALSNLAWAKTRTQSPDENLIRDLVERRARAIGPSHPDTLQSQNLLGNFLYHNGRLIEAADVLRCALQNAEPGDLEIRYLLMHSLGNALKERHRYNEAEELIQIAAYGRSELIGKDHPQTLYSLGTLAEIYLMSERIEQAHQLARELYDKALLRWGPKNGKTPIFENLLKQTENALNKKNSG